MLAKSLTTKIAVLVSGGGTNLQALINAQNANQIKHGELACVIASNETAFALERAKKAHIPTEVLVRKTFKTIHDYDNALIAILEQYDVDLIVLAGFMTIISDNIITKYRNKIINIHPSLIPSFCGEGFYGLRVHQEALARGVKITGATTHFVNEICDGGPIIMQKAIQLEPGDSAELLQKKVMEEAEWQILPKSVSLFCEGKLQVQDEHVLILD